MSLQMRIPLEWINKYTNIQIEYKMITKHLKFHCKFQNILLSSMNMLW